VQRNARKERHTPRGLSHVNTGKKTKGHDVVLKTKRTGPEPGPPNDDVFEGTRPFWEPRPDDITLPILKSGNQNTSQERTQ